MKIFFLFFYCLLFQQILTAQLPSQPDSLGNDVSKSDTLVDPGMSSPNDTLRQDDLQYNPRSPVIEPIIRVNMVSLLNWSRAFFMDDAYWAKVGFKSWKRNLRFQLEWDNDGLYTNLFGHPYTGNKYFNVARSNGYTFFQSIPFTVGGSFLWEFFGENELPSRSDLLATSMGGVFFGEIFYRISSNILDDRTRGKKRVYREFAAGIVNPTRALNRITDGKMFRHTPKEVYQKEPMVLKIQTGVQQLNTNKRFATGRSTFFFNALLDYGNPFELRKRKPFEYFNIKAEIRLLNGGTGHTYVSAYAFLFGKSINRNNRNRMFGLFQYYDYWDQSNIFHLGMVGYGPGLLSKLKMGSKTVLQSGAHLVAIPVSQSRRALLAKDSAAYTRFIFGGGIKGHLEENLNWNNRIFFSLVNSYYKMFSYQEIPGTYSYTVIKPGIQVKIFKKINLGFEQQVTYFKGKSKNIIQKHSATEQNFFLQVDL